MGHKWSSEFEMLRVYLREDVHPFLPTIRDREFNALMLTAVELQDCNTVYELMIEFHEVSMLLQSRDATLDDAKTWFQILHRKYADHLVNAEASRLRATSAIVHNQEFENAICKVSAGKESELTVAEALSIAKFSREEVIVLEDEDDLQLSITELSRKAKARKSISKGESKYIPLDWIPATTCDAERLFSLCKHIFSEFRKRMSPSTLEGIAYLRINRQYWDATTVLAVKKGEHKALVDDIASGDEDQPDDSDFVPDDSSDEGSIISELDDVNN